MNVVSIMAHQDDEMQCLGTMLRCRDRGDALFFVTMTDGSKGFVHEPSIAREEAARVRDEEMQALAGGVAAEYINLREPDEFLYDAPDVRMKLIEAMRRVKADVVFTHYHDDYNLDHTTTCRLVRHCAMQSCLPVLPTNSAPLASHPAVFMVEPTGAFPFMASHYVDVTPVFDEKVRLLQHHRSQETAMRQALGSGFRDMCEKTAAYRGAQVGVEYAECFTPMPGRLTIKPYPVLP